MRVMNYLTPTLACLVFPFLIPIMLMMVAVACVWMVLASTKYDL